MALTYHQSLTAVIESDDPVKIEAFIRADPSRLTDDSESDPCIIMAAASGKLKAVECLFKLGADINVRGGLLDTTALEEAVNLGHLQVVKFLLSNGALFDMTEPDHNPYFAAMHRSGRLQWENRCQ